MAPGLGHCNHSFGPDFVEHVAGSIPKTAARAFRKMLKRHSVILPTIGNLKSDHRLKMNYMRGKAWDIANALMSGLITTS